MGIHSQSFGLYFRSANRDCTFTLDCWKGPEAQALGFQNPQCSDEWIIACHEGQQQNQDQSLSLPILEVSGMLPEHRMLTPSISRFLDYQRELVK